MRRPMPVCTVDLVAAVALLNGADRSDTQSHPSNAWDEARQGVPRSPKKRRCARNSSGMGSSEISPLRKAEVPLLELHPAFDGWRGNRRGNPPCVRLSSNLI